MEGLKGYAEAIESLNFSLRKIIKNRTLFSNGEAVFMLLYPALKNIEKKWTMPKQFAIVFEGGLPLPEITNGQFTQPI